MELAIPLLSFVVGALVGITGMGGGSIMTALLILVFNVPPLTAVGTDLIYAAATKSTGVLVHHRKGSVDWRIAGLLAVGSLPASLATLFVMAHLMQDGAALGDIVARLLGLGLVLLGATLLLRRRLKSAPALQHASEVIHHANATTMTIALGFALGVVVTLCSVGAGAIGVAALLFLYPMLASVRVVGTDIAHAVPLTLFAGLGHASLGTVDWELLSALLIGSIPGIWVGSHLAHRVPERLLLPVLAIILVVIGGRLLVG